MREEMDAIRQTGRVLDLIDLAVSQQKVFDRIAAQWRDAARVLPAQMRATLLGMRMAEAEAEHRVDQFRQTLAEAAAAVTEASAKVCAVQCDAELLREDAARTVRRLNLHRI
jgi:hypothetical protein